MTTRVRVSRDFWIGLFAVFALSVVLPAFVVVPFNLDDTSAVHAMEFFFPIFFGLLLMKPLREFHAAWRATRWESEK